MKTNIFAAVVALWRTSPSAKHSFDAPLFDETSKANYGAATLDTNTVHDQITVIDVYDDDGPTHVATDSPTPTKPVPKATLKTRLGMMLWNTRLWLRSLRWAPRKFASSTRDDNNDEEDEDTGRQRSKSFAQRWVPSVTFPRRGRSKSFTRL